MILKWSLNCFEWAHPRSNMAVVTKNRNIYFQLLLSKHWASFNQTWLEGSLVGPLSELFTMGPYFSFLFY